MKLARFVSAVVSLGCFAVLSAGCEIDARSPVEGGFDRTLAVTGPVDLDIRSGSGSVQIDTGPENTVHVVAHIRSHRWFGGDTEDRVKRIEAAPPIEQSGNSIRIGQGGEDLYQNVSISYEVTVPKATRVRSVVGLGRQTMNHVQGPVDVITGSGGLRLGEIAGDIKATAGSGGIEITGARRQVHARAGSGGIRIEGQPLEAWDLKTGSGGITMRVVGETPFDLDASTGSGGIESLQPVSASGESSRRRLHGTVRGGGAQVQLSTGSGGIRIQ